MNRQTVSLIVATIVHWVVCQGSAAQELSPRAYWPGPKGTQVAIFGYSYSFGDVATDPSLPVFGVDSRINNGLIGYLHTLSLWGRTSNLIVELPYSRGSTVGNVEGTDMQRDFSGFGDLGVTLSINLLGGPSMGLNEFQALRAAPRPILGASLKVLAPTGRYETDRLINVSANRWAAKAELGYMIPIKPRLLLEIEVGAWFFGDNDEFLGVTRKQDPIFATEVHLVRRFKPGFWASLDANFYTGGRSTVDGEHRADLQRNSRFGGTIVVPLAGRHAVKFGYSGGMVTRSGGDFDIFLLSYVFALP
ncbi:MAG: transporter [bacterium]|nr:transporter [bacterium]